MLRSWDSKIAQEKVYAGKKPKEIWDANVANIVISKLVKTKPNSKYLIGTKFNKAIRTLDFIMPKISGYIEIFKVKEGEKDKNNKFMSFHIDDEKLLEKHTATWTKIEDF